ncbi:MAG: pyridoxal-phosphate dependent enzyme, partial [Methanomassiliicoccaceae archaeon]|nr:pyridoxal-phosphate dependent enzyme [Methanomassiliicoccaceae archaeon]
GGHSVAVSDAEILAAQKLLGRREGIGVEPASAASIAGAKKLRDMGVIDPKERVVCICTGNALKDPDTIISSSEPVIKCSNNLAEIRKLL